MRSGAVHNGNRQDAREGGETPPLPRNCERPCLTSRRIGQGRKPAKAFPPTRGRCRTTTGGTPSWRVFGKVAGEGASQETGPRRPKPACVPRGTKEPSCLISGHLRTLIVLPSFSPLILLLACHDSSAHAASIRGVVTDASGAKVTGATVALINNGEVVASAVSGADGSFQILTGVQGRFFLVVSAKSFRQLETPGFYAGRLDTIERNLVLEPEWVRESIVVTATGTPTPQPQTSAATSVLGPLDLALRDDLVSALRLMPGTFVVQDGQLGAQTSLFIRGGDSDVEQDPGRRRERRRSGRPIRFWAALDHAVETRRGLSRAELEPLRRRCGQRRRQPDHAARHHQLSLAPFPRRRRQLLHVARRSWKLAGAHNKLDYLGAFSWLQTANHLPNDEYPRGHDGSQSGLAAQRDHADSRHRALWRESPPAFPTRGTSITLPTTPRKRIRTSI